MKKSLLLIALLTLPLLASQTTTLEATWQKAFGGSKDDVVKGVTATKDGGVVIVAVANLLRKRLLIVSPNSKMAVS